MEHNGRKVCFCSQCQKALVSLVANRGNAPRSQFILEAVLDSRRSKETKSSRALARN